MLNLTVAGGADALNIGISPGGLCEAETTSATIVEQTTRLLSPAEGATLAAGAPVTFTEESHLESTPKFSVASSPLLLSAPDIDSGTGSLISGSQYELTSAPAATLPRTIYWDVSFTFTPRGCEAPVTLTTPPRTLIIAPAALPPILIHEIPVHVQRRPAVNQDMHLHFSAPKLPEGGYYYAVIVLKPYEHYTRYSPPRCSTSSNMQRADYGYPGPAGIVGLALTPAKSATGHWCRGGVYEGAVYAVPHTPPCERAYPCSSEPYKPPSPCWSSEGHVACGIVAKPRVWRYPDSLPRPLASGTKIVARFSIRLPHR